MAFHFLHGVAVTFVLERIAEARNPLQASQYESTKGFETGVARQDEPVLSLQISNILCAFQH